ncbi:hypothetical protein GGR50DRAFT_521011 [Xylaria sp. CBS 124048]|nr:hypothetical protein GGR50DRAFT_521011 [Xylaria sp. CBS 124048]
MKIQQHRLPITLIAPSTYILRLENDQRQDGYRNQCDVGNSLASVEKKFPGFSTAMYVSMSCIRAIYMSVVLGQLSSPPPRFAANPAFKLVDYLYTPLSQYPIPNTWVGSGLPSRGLPSWCIVTEIFVYNYHLLGLILCYFSVFFDSAKD